MGKIGKQRARTSAFLDVKINPLLNRFNNDFFSSLPREENEWDITNL